MPKKDKKISSKNYLYAFLILLGAILFTLYIFSWYQVKKEEKLMYSYLITTNTLDSTISDLESIDEVINEVPESYFIYFSYTGDEEVYKLEKSLKRVIDQYRLNDSFYYVDMTKYMEDNDYLDKLKDKFKLSKLERLPVIIYVQNGIVSEDNILDGNYTKILDAKDFSDFLEKNNFTKVK